MFSILIKYFLSNLLIILLIILIIIKIIIFLKQTIIFRILGSRNLGSSAMTHAPSVPKWGTSMAHSQRIQSATYAQGFAQPPGRYPNATCAQH
jgi:hypothetical protein